MPNLNCSVWRGPANPRTTGHGKSRRRGLTARSLGTAALLLAFTGAASAQAPGPASAREPLTLKRAIELALRNSHEMAFARLQQKVAEKSAMSSKADFLPNLYAGSGAAYTDGIPQTPGGSAPSVFDVSYTQQIFNPPLKGQARELQERISAQKFEVENLLQIGRAHV